jgi:hypothetical protein
VFAPVREAGAGAASPCILWEPVRASQTAGAAIASAVNGAAARLLRVWYAQPAPVYAAFPEPDAACTSPGTSRVHSGIPPVGDAIRLTSDSPANAPEGFGLLTCKSNYDVVTN